MAPHGPRTEAISSVLGTFMTIAIAVLIAIALMFMLRVITDRDIEKAPTTSLARDEQADSLTFVAVEVGQTRGGYEIRLSVAGDFDFGAVPSDGRPALAADSFALMGGAPDGPADAPLQGADKLYLCATGAAADDVIVSIRHIESNKMIFRDSFLNIGACPP